MLTTSRAMNAAAVLCFAAQTVYAGQVPMGSAAPDIPVSNHDRVYLADQFSNTVSVVDPSTGKLLGALRLGETTPTNLSPLYRGQLLVHGMGFSPDHRTLDVVSIGSNSVTFIDTQTNAVKHVEYVGRSPHEAMFTPDGKEVWVTIRGEDYVQVLDGASYKAKLQMSVPNGPGMTIFSPDGRYGYVCSSFSPETVVISTRTHKIVGRVVQPSPFCPDIAATPDGTQIWQTLKDVGKVQVFDAKPPFEVTAVLDTGPITNHVNIVVTPKGQFAYVTVGGLNEVKVFTTDVQPKLVTTIPMGDMPHGLWPSGDGSLIAVGLENANAVALIDTATNTVEATISSGQAPQGMVYIPNAVPQGEGLAHLEPLGKSGEAAHLVLGSPGSTSSQSTAVINNQGLVDIIQVAAVGLDPRRAYFLATSLQSDGSGVLTPIAKFMTNPAGAAIVDAVGALRAAATGTGDTPRQYLVIASEQDGKPQAAVQVSR
jgi:YVTN family beta-propeller protein